MPRRRAPGKVALLGPIAVAVPFAIAAALTAESPDSNEVLTFRDSAIVESSGLVLVGDLVVTTNDSGDSGRVFTVSSAGRTVGVTTWSDEPVDVEALAPAGTGHVWVGDIGDNPTSRASVSVTRVPVGEGNRSVSEPALELRYPDGPHDAEALLAHPSTGRLYVVTKEVFGGGLYEAPAELEEGAVNRLRLVAPVLGMVTDGHFLPDGRHLALRTYTRAAVYTFPGLESVGEFELPRQLQGEGLAVATSDTVYLSSEGVRSKLLRVRLPDRVVRAMEPESSPTASGSEEPRPTASTQPTAEEPSSGQPGRDVWPWLLGGGVMVLMTITLLRALRPR